MNSHIQIPNGVLKRFRNPQTGKVFYLDLQDEKIHSTGTQKLGTEKDFYSIYIEKTLNQQVETPYLTLAMQIQSFADRLDQNSIQLNTQDEDVLKRFVTITLCRSNLARQQLKNSFMAELFPEQQKNELLIHSAVAGHNGIFKLFDFYMMGILINRTDEQMVIGQNCVYSIRSQDSPCFIVPISPVAAFALVPNSYEGNLVQSEENRLGFLNDPNYISLMNIAAMRYEYAFNQGFVVGNRRKELLVLQSFKKDHKDVLEKDYKEVNG